MSQKKIEKKSSSETVMTKLDYIIGELAQMRKEILFLNRDIRDLRATDSDQEKRISDLE